MNILVASLSAVIASGTVYASTPTVEEQMTMASRQPGMPDSTGVRFTDCGLGVGSHNENLICCRIVPQ